MFFSDNILKNANISVMVILNAVFFRTITTYILPIVSGILTVQSVAYFCNKPYTASTTIQFPLIFNLKKVRDYT